MSDYSDEDFEMSGSGTAAGAFHNPKTINSGVNKPPAPKKSSPFQQKGKAAGGFSLANDSDDDGYAPGGQGVTSGDNYDEDDFDEEEEEQFKKTAVEFAKKLSALRDSTNYQMAEGGEEPTSIKQKEETKRAAAGRSVGRQPVAASPPQSSYKAASRATRQNDEITDAALKSPSMLKTTMDKQGKGKSRGGRSPSQNIDGSMVGGGTADKANPFRFIEAALNEAKSKIEKMKNTPQILDSLPDDEKKKKFLKAENKLLRENLKRMSDNVNVLIEKMNQESMRKRRAQGGRQGAAGSVASNNGGGMSMQGDTVGGDVTIDETGRPIQGGVGSGLVPGHLPQSQKGLGAQSNAGQSQIGQSVRGGGGYNQSPNGRGQSMNRGGASVAERELQNTDKAIVNLMKEHNKLKKRLEMIQQPDFLLNLKRDLKTTQEEIKQQEKLKRQLKVDQLRREKKLDNLIDQSEPDVLKQVQDTTQRLAYLTEKLAKLEEENKKAEELRNQQIDQLEELRNRLAKLNTIAEHYGVSVEKSKENMAEHKKLTEQLEHLQKQKRILTQAIDTQTRKQEALTAEKKRDLEQLQMRKGEILAKYNERVVELREKGLQIRDLIDRAKTEADDGLQDILDKWQQANERILEKYPEGSQMSFAQLEEAARNSIEYEQQENADQSLAGPRDRKSSVNRAGKGKKSAMISVPAKDDEMQIYLSEIREKQESLINKLRYDQQAAQALQEQTVEESVQEVPEESKNEAASSVAGSLKSRRNLVPSKKAPSHDNQSDASAASLAQAELAQVRAELEREKAEKAKLAEQMLAEKEKNAAQQMRKAEESAKALAEKQRIEQEQNNQIMEGGQEVIPEPVVIKVEETPAVRTSQVSQVTGGSALISKPQFGSKPKLGISSSKPALGLKPSSNTANVVKAEIEDKTEEKSQVQQQQAPSQPASRYEPNAQSIEVKASTDAPQKAVQEVQASKPISFLDRARMARKQPESQAQDGQQKSIEVLDDIQKQNNEARRSSIEKMSDGNNYNPTARESTLGNQVNPRGGMNPLQNSIQSGYQPSSMHGQVPVKAEGSQNIAPRRRRAGDSPKNVEVNSSAMAERPREFKDPFANVAPTLGSNMNVGASLAPSQKKPSYEDKLKAEAASKGSFLDMIGGGGPAASQAPSNAPSKRANEPMMMKASVASAAPSQLSSKPSAKPNLIANLDDLEDLA